MGRMKPRMLASAAGSALGLVGLALFLVLVGTPPGIVALLAIFTTAAATVLTAALGLGEGRPDRTAAGVRAPPPLSSADTHAPHTAPRAPPLPISVILNPHVDNRRRRASRTERDAVIWQLEAHFFDERLDASEFNTRHDYTLKAITRGDLADLLSDLPRLWRPPRQ